MTGADWIHPVTVRMIGTKMEPKEISMKKSPQVLAIFGFHRWMWIFWKLLIDGATVPTPGFGLVLGPASSMSFLKKVHTPCSWSSPSSWTCPGRVSSCWIGDGNGPFDGIDGTGAGAGAGARFKLTGAKDL